MHSRFLVGVASIVVLLAALPTIAQQGSPRQITVARRPDVPGGRALPVPVRGTSVMGFAWSSMNDPIADATVRLRNVLSGAVEATDITSQSGEFVFENIEGGSTYVVELVGENGSVRAVGQPFTIAPGETVATFVRLGVRAPWFTGMFGNSAAAAVSTAASLGVAAVAPPSQSISATR